MDTHLGKKWKVLSWNVRGLNSSRKWDTIKNKIVDAGCDIVCLQETKTELVDLAFLKKFCPPEFDAFVFLPSIGASGGILIAWKGNKFSANRTDSNDFSISVQLTSLYDNSSWGLTAIYAPCTPQGRNLFLNWLRQLQVSQTDNQIILGDFNLIRKPEDRNKPGGDINLMFRFNEIISHLGLNEISLKGRKYTWSNMQHPAPLMEKLDWIFTNSPWTTSYPNTSATALDMTPSDHCPCIVSIATDLPTTSIFRFNNNWLGQQEFQQILSNTWGPHNPDLDPAKVISSKMKSLRRELKKWHSSKISIKTAISNTKLILLFLRLLPI